jgi:hypothetical protein
MSQPLFDAATAVWRLTVVRYLLLCNLPWVSLLEASLACRVPSLPREADK